jgi:dTDP-4-amino-4,6-dideoxygalactose transaminase
MEHISSVISDKTRAVVLGDLFGYPMPREGLQGIEPPLIMDISSTLAPEEEMDFPGASFLVASFSSDMLLTTGYGGMVQTTNSRHYSSMRDLRWSENRPNLDSIMTDLQAAMGISQLSRLKAFIKRRKDIARIYSDSLKTTEHKTPFVFSEDFTYQAFPVHFDAARERVDRYWKKNGVEVLPLLPHPGHQRLGLRGMDYPNSDRLSRKLYGIPMYPTLTKKEIEKISRLLASFL